MTGQSLDRILAALADPTRRAIVARLAQGPATVGEISAPFGISQPAISRHLKVLEQAGLVESGRAAQARPRRLKAEALSEVALWLEPYRQMWEARFRRLDGVLEQMQTADAAEVETGATRGTEQQEKGEPR